MAERDSESVRVHRVVTKVYRDWAKQTGRSMVSLIGFALRFAAENRAAIEQRIAEGWKK